MGSLFIAPPCRVMLPHASNRIAAACAAVGRWMRRLDAWLDPPSQGPQTAQDVLDYALRIENSHPSLAADLRSAAKRAND